jgi:UDP-N-acetylglucosamine--N-acetylmuramyl-(pentapeptide) pyrophosphoryl-undecaprenol N-acetylglucosamine transferase
MTDSHIVFAGGGTGGHLFPGMAVAAAVRRRAPRARVTFFTTNRPLDAELLGATEYARVPQPVRPFSPRPWRWPAFWLAWRSSVAAARAFFLESRPTAVLGLGGYAAGPPVVAARQLGIRTAILNPDAAPGRANRFLASRCDLIVLQWEISRRCFSAAAPCRTLGCPIRPEFSQPIDTAEARRRFGLDSARPVVLVTGASQGAGTINDAVIRLWPDFAARHHDWQLLHLTGTAHEAATRAAYDRAGIAATIVGFVREMWLALAAADLVISRAGASTLAELTALRKPSILLPYPYHRDRHQHANAQVLADAGAAEIVNDRRVGALNREPLLAALERVADPSRRAAMSAAAASLARPHAAEAVSAWLLGE